MVLFESRVAERSDIMALSLEDGTIRELLRDGSSPRYAETGHIIFTRGSSLHAAAFDPEGRRVVQVPPFLGRASFEVYSFFFVVVRRNDVYPGESFDVGFD